MGGNAKNHQHCEFRIIHKHKTITTHIENRKLLSFPVQISANFFSFVRENINTFVKLELYK